MDSFEKDMLSFQEKINKLNDYGVQVTSQKNGNEESSGKVENVDLSGKSIKDSQSSRAQKTDSKSIEQRRFVLKSGMNVSVSDRPIDYFFLLVDKDILDIFLQETNVNLQEMREEKTLDGTGDTCYDELLRFVSLLFHMGTIQLNRMVDYWNSDSLFNIPCFAKHMPRNRFMILLKCLQNTNLIESFNRNMNKLYTAGRLLTVKSPFYYIDKRLRRRPTPLSGTVTFNCVSEPSGVVLKCLIADKISENIVPDLLLDLTDCNRTVYVSQTYSSVRVAHILLEQSTTCTSILPNDTLRLATMVQEKALIGIIQKGVLIGRWKKDRTVFFSSEFPIVENIDGETVPKAITEYNKYVGDDVVSDELLTYYSCEKQQMSFDKKIIIHMLQIMLMNAYYMYRESKESRTLTLYDFRLEIIRELLNIDYTNYLDNPEQSLHKPTLIKTDSSGRRKSKKCAMCFYQKGVKEESLYCCLKCPNVPGLCLEPCFASFHALYPSEHNLITKPVKKCTD